MKNSSDYSKTFASLYQNIKQKYSAEPPPKLAPVTQLVVGFLQWNSTQQAALDAHERLMSIIVDNNDLRVSQTHELVALIGPDFPQAEERVVRLHDCLQEIYLRERAMLLKSLVGKSKKDVRNYLETLPGITPYVAAHVIVLCFGAHAIPVDDTLAHLLQKQGAADPTATPVQIAAFLERQLRAGHTVEAHVLLQHWADAFRPSSLPADPGQATRKTTGRSGRKTAQTSGAAVKKPTRHKSKKPVS